MELFKTNYNKLSNLRQLKFNVIVIIVILLFVMLIFLALNIEVYKKFECMGIYSNNTLKITINSELSDNLKNAEYIIFQNKKLIFQIVNFGNYEVIDNTIFQEIDLSVDEKFYDNEIGLVEFYYQKQKLLFYIFDLFK